ncbi:hypothetical protein SAMN04487895_11459 [Paenibacillus sophorae]|uniref:Peptidase C-terminal archaeal/bacterial domain-containing protein n=1 Tax=Paenibacillus sophorae TaxID=1333845 RepID=A0A1H8THY7_9BACL|nr:hypothetical protein [Paenibacillus sophorae]QWU16218.1 hypothetical protein KP014_02800 [Paenibacillus sophorae]SEO90497.1 hypothetical protein SAMN04487895_11459 [Paenibacillus sophorae]
MRKTLSIVIVMNLVFSFAFGLNAFAADDMAESGATPDAHVTEQVLQPSGEIISELTKAAPEMDSSKLKQHQVKAFENLKSASTASKMQKGLIAAPQSISSTATAATYTYTGYIQQESTSSYLYPIYVQPGSILQVQMDSPASAQLDYDLYLYEFDMSTGELNPNPIDYSIYGTYLNNYENGSGTLAENVGTRNSTAGSKAYLIEAYGAVGGSINDPFYLTVSTSSTYDAYETDENALHAYPFTVATGGSTLASRSINSEVDQDWYTITVPESRNYDAMHIDLDQASLGNGYKAELYSALSNNRMALTPSENGNVSLGTGTYYLRVYTTNAYSDNNYSLHLQPVLRADKLVITGYNSNGGPNDYPSYAYGRYYRITGNSFTVTGVAATSDNYAVANAEVEVIWENDNWSEGSNNRYRSGKVWTNSSGEFSITLSLPPSTGSISQYLPGAISFTHYYDICGVLARVTDRPSVNDTDIVYHFAYSIYGG